MVTLANMSECKEFVEERLGNIQGIEGFRAGIVLEDFKEE